MSITLNNKWKLSIVWALLALVLILTYTNLFQTEDIDIIDLEKTQKLITEDIERLTEIEKQIFAHIPDHIDDVGHMEKYDQFSFRSFKDKEGAVKYLFASIFMNDPELFLHAFDTETISKNLFINDNPNKLTVIEDFIKEISRDGKLENIGFLQHKGVFGVKTEEASVVLYYNDGAKVTVPLTFIKRGTQHHENDETYFITTSVYEIIQTINNAL